MATFDSFIKQWSTTYASNGLLPNIVPYGWPEGMPPSAVNDCARQAMGDHRYQWEDAEWFCWGDVGSKASATTFKIATDVTSRYQIDRRMKILDTTTKYATIISSSYSAPDTTVGLVFDSETSLAATTLSSIALAILSPTNRSAPNVSSNENIIIGGNFDTNPWQRGTTFTSTANGAYTADRFSWLQSGGGVVDTLKTADAPTVAQAGFYSANCLDIDCTTADGTIGAAEYYTVQYNIEGYDVAGVGFGQTSPKYITLSFWHKHTKTGTYTVGFQNSAANRSYVAEYTQTTASTWEKTTITLQADATGTWLYTAGVGLRIYFNVAIGANLQTTANSWQAGNFIATANQVNGMDANTNNFKLALIKLEIGRTPTAFIQENASEVLLKCQRYFQKSFGSGVTPSQNVGSVVGATFVQSSVAAQSFGVNVPFKVLMRTIPTITTYNPSASNANWRDTTNAADRVVTVGGTLSESFVNILGAAGAADASNFIHWTASAEL